MIRYLATRRALPTAALAAGATLLLALSACGGSDDDATPTSTVLPSLPVDRIAVDVGAADLAANTATTLGAVQQCETYGVGDMIPVDVTIEDIPLEGGIEGFQFELHYDRDLLRVSEVDFELLLAANEGSSLVDFSEGVPDDDGEFVVAIADFGDALQPEFGSGVLARVTFEALDSGTSPITLVDVLVPDASSVPFTIGEISSASVAIDTACPAVS